MQRPFPSLVRRGKGGPAFVYQTKRQVLLSGAKIRVTATAASDFRTSQEGAKWSMSTVLLIVLQHGASDFDAKRAPSDVPDLLSAVRSGGG